jgi:hypothetical protein
LPIMESGNVRPGLGQVNETMRAGVYRGVYATTAKRYTPLGPLGGNDGGGERRGVGAVSRLAVGRANFLNW